MRDNELKHYGTPHVGMTPHSGRWPYGSGDEPYQHGSEFLDMESALRKEGLTEKERAAFFNLSTTELRAHKKLANERVTAANVARAVRLKNEKRYSTREIGRIMGIGESTIRNYLKYNEQEKTDRTRKTADMLKSEVEKKGMIQVGSGVERMIGVSQTQLNTALTMLKTTDGMTVHTIRVEQMGTLPGNKTTVKVLTKKDVPIKYVYDNMDKVHNITEYSHDSGKTWGNIKYPKSISSDRIKIRYAEDGCAEKDGVIELRRNVPDLSLGE
jgi:DNA-binding CsgD family transcriptional regulator